MMYLRMVLFLVLASELYSLPVTHQQEQVSITPIVQLEQPVLKSGAMCTTENMINMLESSPRLLQKAIQVSISRFGIRDTRDRIEESMSKFEASVTESREDSASEMISSDELEVEPNFNTLHARDPLTGMNIPDGSEWQSLAAQGPGRVPDLSSQVFRITSPRHRGGPVAETVLVIPARRLRPQHGRVRIIAKNKNREVRIATTPQMNVLQALKAAEVKIQWQWPELSHQKVIEFERSDELACYVVTRVGQMSIDKDHSWQIKVTYPKTAHEVYNGRCLPDEDVIVRPGSILDLIYTASPV
ncbi:hypothetical protein HDE_03168 [Halotydeus destructor]|nr:hypothetical protein HDE_03168 [Halotydeus destructor]